MQNKEIIRQSMAELIGTMFILLFGEGVCVMNTVFNLGGFVNITFAWGLGVFFGILVSARISGAHLNPAVTIALWVTKRFPSKKVPYYIVAQMLGAFIGAALVYYFYRTKLLMADPTLSHSAAMFTTFPAMPNDYFASVMSELIGTAILMFGILAIIDHFSEEKASFLVPAAVGLLVVGIGMSFGGMHGYGINPARDFSPRLLVTLLDFKNNGLTDGSLVWTQVIVGSLIGGPLGAILYDLTIGKKVGK
ncbi:MAG: hypothetical protein RL017_768 [Pseudomonadota bacterium]|jgi:glycerol uptake facilitator protein|nr:aquaporin family protein [Burkholderiales bacterium]